ncbi:MAG: eukaryotic-like serine/threonine-protein kinase [Blastocatellia bacterium]|jgi:serine/threonine-protein kinase|nr:eukaryotic-like serine/threonine-protein kinase [Blastocatellia bacterium]
MIGDTLLNYRILQKIGAGGQGAVYKATDTKLGRTVVIKVLPPELTVKEANLKRFEREARLASNLDHPNICTIFDLDEAEGVHFIAMQYVEGKNVRQLVNGRPLVLKDALLIAIQVTDALAAAHARGIIHRDIKSGNVMVTSSGQVKILDFGLAKLLDEEAAQSEGIHRTELTEVGVPYGTPTHAAPEQARGDRVDARADIFSMGVLLYEMLTGTWPFQGKTTIDVRHAVLHAQPKPLAEARPGGASPRLQAIIDKALQKEPRDRYQKIAEMRDDLRAALRETAGGGEADAQLAEGLKPGPPRHLSGSGPVSRAVRWLQRAFNTTGEPASRSGGSAASTTSSPHATQDIHLTPMTSVGGREKKSIAILPFRNLNNDAASNFYEFSLADAVITELARLRSLVVRPSSVIARYQGQTVDPRDAGRELNVDAVLSAGFIHVGERFRVTAQLLDVLSGDMLWSDRIDAAAEDIITVQDTIAERIVEGLRIELSPDEQIDMARRATQNAAAYEEYLRGRDFFGRFIFRTVAPEDADAAIKHFQRAVELDPSFALAHDGLGACYVNRVFKGLGSAEDFERAEVAFTKALAFDAQVIEARMLMVFVYLWRGQKQKARDEVARARRESPNEAVVHFVKATLHRLDGEYSRALRSYQRLAELDPAAQTVAQCNRALVYIYLGRGADALRELDKATEQSNPLVHTFRALALYYQGEAAEAAQLMKRVLDTHPNMHGVRPFLAMFLSAQGEHEAARAELTAQVERNAEVDPDIAYAVASVYALEDEREAAFEWLARSIALGNENRACFEHDPNWAALRDDPRFTEMMNKLTPRG